MSSDLVGRETPVVRPLQPEDEAPWRALWEGYNAFYGRAGPTALPAAITEWTLARLCDPDAPLFGLVALFGGEPLGLAHFLVHESTTSLQPACYLNDLFVAPAARGRGLARALVEEVYRRTRDLGCSSVYWHTHETNTVARRLYNQIAHSSGFILYRHAF